MRFCRFGDGRLGLVEGDIVRDVTAALDVLPQLRVSVAAARRASSRTSTRWRRAPATLAPERAGAAARRV